jgi:hypothetical protein
MTTPVSYTLNVARCMSFWIQRNGNSGFVFVSQNLCSSAPWQSRRTI